MWLVRFCAIVYATFVSVFITCIASTTTIQSTTAISLSMPLNEYPFLLTHDAASGELNARRDGHIVDRWTQTQSVGLVGQLNCGARAFDYRPYYRSGTVYAHHGPIVIYKPMEESIEELQQWTRSHPTELVILYVTSCDGDDGCIDASKQLLTQNNVMMIDNCDALQTYTVESILSMTSLVAVVGCVEEQYDPSINCYGKEFTCYDSWPNNTSNVAWKAFQDYVKRSVTTVPVNDGRLWMSQTHWQSTAETVIRGTLHNSSLCLDESRSGMNAWLAASVSDRSIFPNLNLLEVDNVCDHGLDIYCQLQKRVLALN